MAEQAEEEKRAREVEAERKESTEAASSAKQPEKDGKIWAGRSTASSTL